LFAVHVARDDFLIRREFFGVAVLPQTVLVDAPPIVVHHRATAAFARTDEDLSLFTDSLVILEVLTEIFDRTLLAETSQLFLLRTRTILYENPSYCTIRLKEKYIVDQS
jgi:hypothetical protein